MNKMIRPSVLIFAVGALAFSLGYIAFPHDEGDHFSDVDYSGLELDPGTEAASFALERFDGSAVSPADFEGKIVVVDFWATWCGPCLTEVPAYNELHERYRDAGVELLGVTLQSGSAEQVSEWLQNPIRIGTLEFSLDYPVVMGNEEIEYAWGPIYGFPTTYLVDHEWKIRKKWLGAVPDKSEQLRVLIEQLLLERDGAQASGN